MAPGDLRPGDLVCYESEPGALRVAQRPESFEQPTIRIAIIINLITNFVIILFYGLQRLCMKRGWAFEAHHCPTIPNVI